MGLVWRRRVVQGEDRALYILMSNNTRTCIDIALHRYDNAPERIWRTFFKFHLSSLDKR